MYEMDSTIENKVYPFISLKSLLEKEGYVLNGAWEYDHGYFDYKLANDDGYHFLRIPFHTVKGELENTDAVVKMDKPYLLSHLYQNDVDASAKSSVMQATFNQFQTPVEKDADIPSTYIEQGKTVLHNLEVVLSHVEY